ncbi:MAG: MmgE/PrpD family protein [Betaproteobacteria bacterium]|nr:MmgE/PrpD family protein [Betaproteobacteria bacterium]
MAQTILGVSPLMRELSAYIAAAPRRMLPADAVECGKHHLIDTLAAIVSGSRLVPGEMAIRYARQLGGVKESLVIGTRLMTSCVNAALANGMMAHADETDDSHPRAQAHPGCGVVPAALAMAERENASGLALLRAVVLGYDIGTRVAMALGSWALRAKGHSTHSFGPLFGAAAAAGALARLEAAQVRYLLSYTAQQASGIETWARDKEHVEKGFNFGGMPARNGVTAATMVQAGFSGVDDVFAGEKNFLSIFAAKLDARALTRRLGKDYEVTQTTIKRWSVGSPIQAALDSLSALIAEHGIKAADVEKLTVTVNKIGSVTVNNRSIPDINIQHLLSVMLLDGTVTFASSHDEARMHDARIAALKKKIELHGREDFEHPRQGMVEILMRDGRRLTHHTQAVKGTAKNPLTRAQVDAKCLDLTAPILGKARARKLIDSVWRIENVKNVRELRVLLKA